MNKPLQKVTVFCCDGKIKIDKIVINSIPNTFLSISLNYSDEIYVSIPKAIMLLIVRFLTSGDYFLQELKREKLAILIQDSNYLGIDDLYMKCMSNMEKKLRFDIIPAHATQTFVPLCHTYDDQLCTYKTYYIEKHETCLSKIELDFAISFSKVNIIIEALDELEEKQGKLIAHFTENKCTQTFRICHYQFYNYIRVIFLPDTNIDPLSYQILFYGIKKQKF